MLDNAAKKVLKYFIKTNTYQTWDTIAANLDLTGNKERDIELIEMALDDLVEMNCIKKNLRGYKLTNFGKMYFKKTFYDIFVHYIYPILTASISLLLSLLLI